MKRFYPVVLSFLVLVSSCSKSPTTPDAPEKPNTPTIVSFSASPSTITYKESSLLSWSVSNATSVFIDNGIGSVGSSGSRVVSPTETTTYSLRATNAAGDSYKTCKITVEGRAYFEIISYTKIINWLGLCEIDGVLKNTGNMPGDVESLYFSAYSSNTLIDSAMVLLSIGTIPVNFKITFEAEFWKLNSWTKVTKLTYHLAWSSGGVWYERDGVIN